MPIITLMNTQEYARNKRVSRVTVWRKVKEGVLDCYSIPGSKKKWFADSSLNMYQAEQRLLDEILTVDTL